MRKYAYGDTVFHCFAFRKTVELGHAIIIYGIDSPFSLDMEFALAEMIFSYFYGWIQMQTMNNTLTYFKKTKN